MANKIIEDILIKQETEDFYLEFKSLSCSHPPYTSLNARELKATDKILKQNLSSAEGSNNILLQTDGYIVFAKLRNNHGRHKKDEIIGFCIVDEKYQIDKFSHPRYDGYPEIKKGALDEAYIMYLMVNKDLKNIDNTNPKRLRHVGLAMYLSVSGIAKALQKDVVSLISVSDKNVVNFYSKKLHMEESEKEEFVQFHNLELKNQGQICANIIDYMDKNKIKKYKNFLKTINKNKVDINTFSNGCENVDAKYFEEYFKLNPKNKDVSITQRIIEEIVSHKEIIKNYDTYSPSLYQLQPNTNVVDNKQMEYYREFLMIHKDLEGEISSAWKNYFDMPNHANKVLQKMYEDKIVPFNVLCNPYLKIKNSVALTLSNKQIDKYCKVVEATRIELNNLHSKELEME